MSHDISFRRKLIYIAAIALLLFPLILIGQPASSEKGSGGILAQLRVEHDLAQAELGEIDPASESMKLATMGLRGVAAVMLWQKANECKKKENWDALSATLNQITKLQPNYIGVWEFQAHNLSYNISVEFDDYRLRYHWVKKGIGFLIGGTKYNRDNPRLLHEVGWFIGHKIGRADERKQFRQLFREDDDFHDELNSEVVIDDAAGYNGRPDNWLVSRLWYLRAQRAVDTKGMPLRGKSPLIFHNDAPMALINYASTIEEEGVLGQTAQRAWAEAGEKWEEFGRRPIPTSWGENIRLGDHEQALADVDAVKKKFEELLPGEFARVHEKKLAQLTQKERDTLALKEEELTEENATIYYDALSKTEVNYREVAEQIEGPKADKALELAMDIEDREVHLQRVDSYRQIVNYEYWQIRCEAEQKKVAVDAREFVYQARQFERQAELERAREKYEAAWKNWAAVFEQYPRLRDDTTSDELVKSVKRYIALLGKLDEKVPADFPLKKIFQGRDPELDQLLEDVSEEAPVSPPAEDASAEEAADSPSADVKPEDAADEESTEAEPEEAAEPETAAEPGEDAGPEGAVEPETAEDADPEAATEPETEVPSGEAEAASEPEVQ